MARLGFVRRVAVIAVLAAGTLAAVAITAARASIISDTPTLPLLGVPYVASTGVGCFPAAGICIAGGSLTLTSLLSSTFNAAGQDIVTAAHYSGTLTDLSDLPIGTVELSGTVEQEVLGRTLSTEIGSWPTNLVSLLLSGPVLGHTLTVMLDTTPGKESKGETSIGPIPNGEGFRIDSFFDVFVELSLDTPIPLTTTRGPIRVEAVQAVPEPSSVAAIATALPVMLALFRRRNSAGPKTRGI